MPRRKQRNELLAGTFIAISILLAVGVALLLADLGKLFEPRQQVRVIFANQSIKGLRSGATVQFNGRSVGRVRDVRLDYARPGWMEAIIEIPAELRLRANAPCTIGTAVLGGAAWVEISGVGSDSGFILAPPVGSDLPPCYLTTQPDIGGPLPAGPVPVASLADALYGSESPNQLIADLGFGPDQRKQLQASMLSIARMTATLNEIVAELESSSMPKVERALADINRISSGGVELMATLNASLPPALEGVDKTIAEAQKLIEKLSPELASAARRVNSTAGTLDEGAKEQLANVEAALKQLGALLGQAQAAMGDVQRSAGVVRDVLTANRDTLGDTLADLREGSGHLAAGLGEIRREPWRLLHTPKAGEERAANVLASARAYSEGARSLRDATTRLAALVADRGEHLRHDDEQYRLLLDEMKTSQERFDKAERALYALLGAD